MAEGQPGRLERLRARLRAEGLTGLIVTHQPNVRYLTGFSGSSGAVLVLPAEAILVTDFRYAAQAPQEVGRDVRVEIVASDVWERLGRFAGRGRGEGWGFEAEHVTVATARRLADADLAGAQPTGPLVEPLRMQKDAQEIAALRAAVRLAEEAFEGTLGAVCVGATETRVAASLEGELRRRGSEWFPFPTIVASGPRSALPHARTSARPLGRDEIVLLDFGAQVDGYCADLTRVVVTGHPDARARAMFDLVREAQARAIAGLRAGMTGQEGDALARAVIEARGFGDAFGHSLGHGLGLEVHEGPRLSRTNPDPLPAHAALTIEPGVYFPGWGGIRLEDDVILTPDGVELLSHPEEDLVVVGS